MSQGSLPIGDKQREEQAKQEAERTHQLLFSYLEPQAFERLGRLRLVKSPQKIAFLESNLIRFIQQNSKSKITDDLLLKCLKELEDHEEASATKIIRRNVMDDEELDLDQFDL